MIARAHVSVTPCSEPGCPEIVRGGYCPAHQPDHRSPSSKITGTRRWRKLKQKILLRDRYRCHHCGDRATTVDHLNPVVSVRDPWDEANLAASCVPCNLAKGARLCPSP